MTEKRTRGRPLVPFRNGPWGGMTKTTQFVFDRPGFTRIENGYVNADGSEIRRFPGWKTSVDLETAKEATGFDRDVIDAERPQVIGATTPSEYAEHTAATNRMIVRNKPTNLHGFEFVNGKLIIFGESDIRREDIYQAGQNTPLKVQSWTLGATTQLSLTAAPDTTNESENAVTVGDTVLIEGLDESDPSAGVAELNNLLHEVTASAGNIVTINTTTTASSTIGHTGGIYRTKRPPTGSAGGVPWRDPTAILRPFVGYRIDDPECLTVYNLEAKVPNVTSPADECRPAYVANRQRDFGDSPGNMGEGAHTISAAGQRGVRGQSRRHQKELPYRLVPDVAENRLLLAAPGYGCVFEVPLIFPIGDTDDLGANFSYNGVFDKPRCLGVPKAVMLGPQQAAALWRIDATNGNMVDGDYKVAVAYRDEGTGAIGIASDTHTITISGGGGNAMLDLRVMFPGYLMSESLATSIVVYCSEVNGDALGYVETILPDALGFADSALYGFESVNPTIVDTVVNIVMDVQTADINFDNSPLQAGELQMPMGAKALATIRGTTIFAGHLGDVGPRREMVRGEMRGDYDSGNTNFPFRNEVYNATLDRNALPVSLPFNVALPIIPPAYAGFGKLFSRFLFPAPILERTLERMTNMRSNSSAAPPPFTYDADSIRFPRWLLRQPQHRVGDDRFPGGGSAGAVSNQVDVETYLRLPNGICQFSSPGQPGHTPPDSSFFLDNEEGGDGEAVGRWGGSALICSKTQTYLLSWNRTPNGQSPQLVSPEFGCIAPNSMVEFDTGTAWISDRGPVAMTSGGLQWIGQDLERDFLGEEARYRRDDEGMMRHTWSCHDPERGIIMWGLIKKTSTTSIVYRGSTVSWAGTDDQGRSRFPCDEVLVWSYRSNSFSYMTPPTGLEILWMRHGPTNDGTERVHWLAADNRIYTFDDTYADTNNDALALKSTNSGTTTVGATLSVDVDVNTANSRGTDNNHVRVGSKVLVYRTIDSGARVIVAEGSVTGFGSNPNRDIQCNLLGPDGTTVSWQVGDDVVLGAPPDLTITTQHVPFKQNQDIDSVRVEYSLTSRFTAELSLPQLAWMGLTLIDSEGTRRPFTVADEGKLAPGPRFMGISNLDPSGLVLREERMGSLTKSAALEMRFVGAAQVRISQIEMELTVP